MSMTQKYLNDLGDAFKELADFLDDAHFYDVKMLVRLFRAKKEMDVPLWEAMGMVHSGSDAKDCEPERPHLIGHARAAAMNMSVEDAAFAADVFSRIRQTSGDKPFLLAVIEELNAATSEEEEPPVILGGERDALIREAIRAALELEAQPVQDLAGLLSHYAQPDKAQDLRSLTEKSAELSHAPA